MAMPEQQFTVINLPRQSVYSRLAGEESWLSMRAQSSPIFAKITFALILPLVFLMLTGSAFGQKLPEAEKAPSVSPNFFTGSPSDYAGIKKCEECHMPEYQMFEKTPHAKLTAPGKSYITGCEMCHGPGKAHADAMEAAEGEEGKTLRALSEHPIFSFAVQQKITAALQKYPIFHFRADAKEDAAHCLLCHTTSGPQESFQHSVHVAHGVSCDKCHTAHLVVQVEDQSKGDLSYPLSYFYQEPKLPNQVRWLHNHLLKEPQPTLCFSCHTTIQAQFSLPIHHPVPEGVMKCTDCHTPHGTMNAHQLNQPGYEACLKCHVEKRGPYLYEHPAVKVEGCVACHTPHGSTNNFLLVRRETRMVCLQCHTGFHDQANVPHGRLGFQTSGPCTRCHVAIHGSNFDPTLLR